MKFLESSYTRLIMGCTQREVGGEGSTRSRMCYRGFEMWVPGVLLLYVMSMLI